MGYKTTKSKIKVESSKTNSYTEFFYYAFRNILLVSVPLLVIFALILGLCTPHSSAEVSGSTDNVQLTLSTSCTVNAVVTSEHTVSLNGGQLDNNVGNTKLSAYCNDNNGYSIYAVGSSGDIDGNTDLVNTINESYNIHTGVYDDTVQTNPSSWAMKLTAGTGTGIDPVTGESVPTTPPTIINGFDNYSAIPNVYTQVAKRTSGTSMTADTGVSGSYLDTTYQIYANSAQPAGTYNGKVKYVIIHPSSSNDTISDIDAAFALAGKQKVYQDANGSYYAMQDMSTDICNSVTTTGASTSSQLVDIRDHNIYWVTKEKDQHCWMTQNLDLDINGVNTSPLNSNNTDISADAAISGTGIYGTNGGYTEDNGVYTWNAGTTTANVMVDFDNKTAIGWDNQYSLPHSAEGGDIYLYAPNTTGAETRYDSLTDCTDANHAASDCKHYHVGNYYNYTATVASNNTNISAFNVQYNNAENSICPKNWRLPVGTNDGSSIMEFGQLLFDSGITQGVSSTSYAGNGFRNIRQAPLWFVRGGNLYSNTLYNPSSIGRYWSKTVYNASNAYYMYFGNNIYPADKIIRRDGYSVRCVAR